MPVRSVRGVLRRRGFNLIELLVGLAIFTTSLLMILGVFPTSQRSIQNARSLLLGTHVTQELMEKYVRSRFFDDIRSCVSGTTGYSEVNRISTVNGQMRVINYKWSITVDPDSSDHSVFQKRIRCQVTWLDPDTYADQAGVTPTGAMKPRTINMCTVVTRP